MVIIMIKTKIFSVMNDHDILEQKINDFCISHLITPSRLIDIKFHTQALQQGRDVWYDALIIYDEVIR